MHSKGGYVHIIDVPAEATPSGQDITTLVSLFNKLSFYYCVDIILICNMLWRLWSCFIRFYVSLGFMVSLASAFDAGVVTT